MSRTSMSCTGWLCLLLGWGAAMPLAHAVEVTLAAEYRGTPDAAFQYTTPPSSACGYFPSSCRRRLSVDVPFTYTKDTKVTTDLRRNFFLSLPGPRTGQIRHEQTGEVGTVELTFVGVSQHVASPRRNRNPANTRYSMSGSNCSVQAGTWATSTEFVTNWNLNYQPGLCATRPESSFNNWEETIEASRMSLFYTLKLPATFRLQPGRYTGAISYSLGTGQDFDFGDNVSNLSDSTLTFNIEVDVEHSFRVEFGAHTDVATLEPPGGWMAWLDGGRVPPKLASDIPMRVWSSGPFHVYKRCQYDVGDRCGIRNRHGDEVPVQVAVTMPSGIRELNGWRTINRAPLPTGRSAALGVEGQLFTANGPGQLHFDVVQADLKPMLDNPGERYSGDVTVIFDADL